MIVSIGDDGNTPVTYDVEDEELIAKRRRESILQVEGTYLDSDSSRQLFDSSVRALSKFTSSAFSVAATIEANLDSTFNRHLEDLLGEPSSAKIWLSALLLKRIVLFEESFEPFHFTRNAYQI